MNKIVGIGEYIISNAPEDLIKTFALSTCVAVTFFDPFIHLAAMIHIALPTPTDLVEAKRRPGYYATSGIPILIHELCCRYGSQRKDLQVKIFGGATSLRTDDYFKIGARNIKSVKETLSEMELKIVDAHIGESISRSITMSVLSGDIEIVTLPLNY